MQGSAFLFPVREELIQCRGLEYRTGENVGSDLRALLQHNNGKLLFVFAGQLHQLAGG